MCVCACPQSSQRCSNNRPPPFIPRVPFLHRPMYVSRATEHLSLYLDLSLAAPPPTLRSFLLPQPFSLAFRTISHRRHIVTCVSCATRPFRARGPLPHVAWGATCLPFATDLYPPTGSPSRAQVLFFGCSCAGALSLSVALPLPHKRRLFASSAPTLPCSPPRVQLSTTHQACAPHVMPTPRLAAPSARGLASAHERPPAAPGLDPHLRSPACSPTLWQHLPSSTHPTARPPTHHEHQPPPMTATAATLPPFHPPTPYPPAHHHTRTDPYASPRHAQISDGCGLGRRKLWRESGRRESGRRGDMRGGATAAEELR